MTIEQVRELERRVAVYGALADATRLQVVDLLRLGDAGSGELSTSLGVASNLLAHHLTILQRAGVIERHPSEGDRRRSYWRLGPRALHTSSAGRIPPPSRVVFVCTANTARSHLAAALWRAASPIPATSAGTHPAQSIDRGALAAARRHDLDLPDVSPRHLRDVLELDDLVVTVCDRAHEELHDRSALHWSVADPVAIGTADAFDEAHAQLSGRVRSLAPSFDRAC